MAETCTGITIEKVRGIIEVGNYTVRTPYVKSFTISRSRSQFASTFSVTIEVPASATFSAGSDIVIKDEVNGVEKTRFTGIISHCSYKIL